MSVQTPYGLSYEYVPPGATQQVLGGVGAAGDYLQRLIITVNTAATSQVQLKDGSGTPRTIMPNLVGAGIGVYVVEFGALSTTGGWKVTTGAGVEVQGVGIFSA